MVYLYCTTWKAIHCKEEPESGQMTITIAAEPGGRETLRAAHDTDARRPRRTFRGIASTACQSARATHSNFALYALENFKFNSYNYSDVYDGVAARQGHGKARRGQKVKRG